MFVSPREKAGWARLKPWRRSSALWRSRQWFSAARRARYRIFTTRPTAGSISARLRHAVDWPTPSWGKWQVRDSEVISVQKIPLSNRFHVSEWLGSPCPIPQPV
jgi:hypothetical protein